MFLYFIYFILSLGTSVFFTSLHVGTGIYFIHMSKIPFELSFLKTKPHLSQPPPVCQAHLSLNHLHVCLLDLFQNVFLYLGNPELYTALQREREIIAQRAYPVLSDRIRVFTFPSYHFKLIFFFGHRIY